MVELGKGFYMTVEKQNQLDEEKYAGQIENYKIVMGGS